VADQLREARRAESELRTALEETKQARPSAPDDPMLATAVGEETRRVLQAAHEAARDIVSASERRAAEVVGGAENIVAERVRVAEAAAEEVMDRTKAEAAAVLEATRDQCRRMVEEARDARRRILEDLVEKRHGLHLQLEQLRAGKDALSEIVESVSTSVLASVAAVRARLEGAEGQARLAAAGAFAEPEADEIEIEALIPEPALELPPTAAGEEQPASAPDAMDTVAPPPALPAEADVATEAVEASSAEEPLRVGAEPSASDMVEGAPALDALFARIRADQISDEPIATTESEPIATPEPEPIAATGTAKSQASEPVEGPAASGDVPADASPGGGQSEVRTVREPQPGSGTGSEVTESRGDAGGTVLLEEAPPVDLVDAIGPDELRTDPRTVLLARRGELLGPVVGDLARSLKRQLRLEENELLDAFRNLKRGATPSALVPASAMTQRILEASLPALEAAAHAGELFAGELLDTGRRHPSAAHSGPGAREIAARLAEQVVEPIRRRVADGLAERSGSEADEGGAGAVVGPAFRDWKGARVDGVAEDYAADAFAAGTVRASRARGAGVSWIVQEGGSNCPDCDDNGIAGVQRAGEAFPTGHAHPPVHPGCRCLLVPVLG